MLGKYSDEEFNERIMNEMKNFLEDKLKEAIRI